MIGRRIDEQLEHERRSGSISGEERDGRGQIRARARSADRDPALVDAELRGVACQPRRRREAVVEAGRERVLRRQAVLDRRDHARRLGGDRFAQLLGVGSRATRPAAAVQVDERGSAFARRRVQPNRDALVGVLELHAAIVIVA